MFHKKTTPFIAFLILTFAFLQCGSNDESEYVDRTGEIYKLKEKGEELVNEGDYEEALTTYEELIETAVAPQDRILAYYQMGRIYRTLGEERINDENLSPGEYDEVEEFDRALEFLKKATNEPIPANFKDEMLSDVYDEMFYIYEQRRGIDDTIEPIIAIIDEFITSTENYDEKATLYTKKGDILFEEGEYERARTEYEKALEYSPDDTSLMEKMLKVSTELGEEELVDEYITKYKRIESGDVEISVSGDIEITNYGRSGGRTGRKSETDEVESAEKSVGNRGSTAD